MRLSVAFKWVQDHAHQWVRPCLRGFILIGWGLYASTSYSEGLYFLCGPDEDGCFEDNYSACACVLQDHDANSPHCLDFTTIRCIPASQMTHCPAHSLFKNQGDCIATIFHSTQTTPCHVKSQVFCIQHHIQFCDDNGDPRHCHYAP